MRLQKDRIIQRAIAVLDQEGLDGLTLRRLAKDLGVQAPALYWHIPDKETLLGEMANAILEEQFGGFDFADDQRDWVTWLTTLAHELRAAMLSHREGARVVAGAHLGVALTLTRLIDLSIRVLHNAGFSYSKATTITSTVTNFTFGFVIEEQASPPLMKMPNKPAHGLFELFPTFVTAVADWMQEDYTMHFETSVRIIINGVRAELQP